MNKIQVALVQMPVAPVYLPSFALSILKRALTEQGLTSRVFYANLDFARRIGHTTYARLISGFWQYAFVGERVFAPYLGLPLKYAEEEYIQQLLLYEAQDKKAYEANIRQTFSACAAVIPTFLTHLADEILAAQPQIVAFASLFCQHNAALALARILKERCPELIIMLGGANVFGSGALGVMRHIPYVDYTFSGEADTTFAPLCERLITQGRSEDSELPYGVISHSLAEAWPAGQEAPFNMTTALDAVPLPDYSEHAAALAHYGFAPSKRRIFYEFSRGCWWHAHKPCTFCGLNHKGDAYRIKSTAKILRDLEQLKAEGVPHGIALTDNVLSPIHLKEVLPHLQRAQSKPFFFAEVRSSLSREELLQLSDAGVKIVQAGIESVEDGFLTAMHKGVRAIKQIEFLRNSVECGLTVLWNLLVGFPGEKEQWYDNILALLPSLEHLPPPQGLVAVMLTRDSVYDLEREKFALQLEPYSAYAYVYPDRGDYLGHMAYVLEEEGKEQGFISADRLRHSTHAAKRKLWILTQAWRSKQAYLREYVYPDRLEIMDFRTIAKHSYLVLRGVEKDVYTACRTATKRAALYEKLSASYSEASLSQAVENLLQNKLLLEINGELVALAIRDPERPMLNLKDNPVDNDEL